MTTLARRFFSAPRPWLMILLVSLLTSALPLEAALKKDEWRSATAEERLNVPAALSNVFFYFHTRKPIMAYAGSNSLSDDIVSSEIQKKEFIEGVIRGIQRTGLVLKTQKAVMINGVAATETYFFTPSTEAVTLGVFCISGTRFTTLLVVSKDPLAFDSAEFTALVKELPIKAALPFRTDSTPELKPAEIAPTP